MMQDPISIAAPVLQQYGPLGVILMVVLYLYIKQNKRVEDLENLTTQQYKDEITRMDKGHEDELVAYKELIKDYVQLVENNTMVLSKLTACVDSFKQTLEGFKKA